MSIATTPEAVIDLHEQGETTGKLWAGTFRCMKYMTHRQKLARDKLIRDYLVVRIHNIQPKLAGLQPWPPCGWD